MAKTLKANVYVDGVLYGPDGEKPDAEVAKRIDNPKAWSGEDVDSGEPDFPEGDPSEEWTGKQLKAYATANSVDLGGATAKADMVAAIQAAPGA